MSNYTWSGEPTTGSRGRSALIRTEFSNIQTAVNSKADLESPAFTGTPTAPTAATGTSTTQIATTQFVANTSFSTNLPGQAGNANKVLTTDGSNASWQADLRAGTIRLVDNSDTTKKLAFDVSGFTTSTTRTLTVPNATGTIVLEATTQTLTNKTVTDSTFTIQDEADNTKKMQFQLSSIATGTTRTLTIPNATDTVVLEAATQTLTNKTVTDSTFTIQDEADNTKKMQFQLSSIATGTTRTLTVPNVSGTFTLNAATQTLTNKTVEDTTFTVRNTTDTTKLMQLNLASIATGTTRTLTVPDATGNIVVDTATQTLTNKTVTDSTFTIQDEADNTKKMQFQLSSIATGTTRTLSFLNSNLTVGSIIRIARTSNVILTSDDTNKWIDITSGTFTQTFSAASSLGSGWWVIVSNNGTGDITLDPDGTETIDGLTTFIMYPGEARIIQCTGTAFESFVLAAFRRTFLSSGTFTKAPGYTAFSGLLWGGGGSGSKNAGTNEGGGGGGGCSPFTIPSSFFANTETVAIGAGGAAQTGNAAGNPGGNSTLGSLVTGYGGSGGINDAGGGGGGLRGAGSGAAGGDPDDDVAGTHFYNGGGDGGSTAVGNSSHFGGGGGGGAANAGGTSIFGGGGGAGNSGVGTASGGTSVFGGNGGASGTSTSGVDGAVPGGGGGSTDSGTQSGAGGAGQLTIWGVV